MYTRDVVGTPRVLTQEGSTRRDMASASWATSSVGAITAYHSLASCMVEEEKINREYQMYGHRQTKPPGGTECPGDVLYGTIQEWEGWVSGGVIFLQSLIIIFQKHKTRL